MIVAAALVVTGVFFLNEYVNKNNSEPLYVAPDLGLATTSSLANIDNVDTDQDGLKDWEEVLWGTDVRKTDSDTDGTSDGAEVNGGRNPIVKKTKTVDDRFTALAQVAAKAASSSEANLTLTDKFSRDIFSQYLYLRQQGQNADKQSQENLINQILTNSLYTLTAKVYADTDLRTSSDNTAAGIKQYGNAIGAIFKNNAYNSRNEGVIVRDALQKEDMSILKELDPIIVSYQASLNQLLKTPSPATLFTAHKSLVNAMSRLLFVVNSYRKLESDPIVSLHGVASAQEGTKELFDAFSSLRSSVASAGVTFSTSEPGYTIFYP